jgi:DNA-binding transcriptional ArsR family regulator
VESVFEVIAEPNRRAILSLLILSEQSVGEIERQLRMSQPTISKHLRVLRETGFVESTVDAQRRLYRLRPEPLQELDAWLAPFRRFWSAHVDALERHLDRMDDVPSGEGLTLYPSTPEAGVSETAVSEGQKPSQAKGKPGKRARRPNREHSQGETK